MRGTARAEDAQGTPTQSHISPSVLSIRIYKWTGIVPVGSDRVGVLPLFVRGARHDLVHGWGLRVQGPGFRVQGSGFGA